MSETSTRAGSGGEVDVARAEVACLECGRDDRNGTHAALERTGHLSHPFAPSEGEGVPDALAWAEMLTHQECADQKHPDWFIDSEHNILCPWCRAESAEAAHADLVAKVEALADAYTDRPHQTAQDVVASLRALLDEIAARESAAATRAADDRAERVAQEVTALADEIGCRSPGTHTKCRCARLRALAARIARGDA